MKLKEFTATVKQLLEPDLPGISIRYLLVKSQDVHNPIGVVVEKAQVFCILVDASRMHYLQDIESGDTVQVNMWLNTKTYRNKQGALRYKNQLLLSRLTKIQ